MSPKKEIEDGRVRYVLDEEDLALMASVRLVHGAVEEQEQLTSHEMCVMQMVSLLTTEADKRASLTREAWEVTTPPATSGTSSRISIQRPRQTTRSACHTRSRR